MWFEIERLHYSFCYATARFEYAREQARGDLQTGFGRRSGNVAQHRFQRAQRLPCPVLTDGGKQAMLNRIPFGAAGRVVAHRDGQSQRLA